MLIPLGTDVRLRRPTLVTYVLMALCVGVFIAQQVVDARTPGNSAPAYEPLVLYGYPSEDVQNARLDRFLEREGEVFYVNEPRVWQFVTYQFLHGGWMHLIGNMVFLLVFGPPVEDRFRRSGFLALYLVGGVMAGVAHGLFETTTTTTGFGFLQRDTSPVIGASGSIAAVTGAYLVLFPRAPVRVFVFFFVIGRFAVPGWIFVCLSVAYDLLFLAMGSQGVAHMAHLGGYAMGAGIAMFLLWRRVLGRETYDLFSIARQAHRRRQYRALVTKNEMRSPYVSDAACGAPIASTGVEERADGADAERRAIVQLARTDADAAATRYVGLLKRVVDATLSRDAQLAVGNALYTRGDAEIAAEAYALFIKRYADDREADGTRLLLAMIHTRTLNDPVGATRLLDEIDSERLPEDQRALWRTLREELA